MQGEEARIKGWVLVRGVASQSGWVWRWLVVKSGTLELFREQVLSLLAFTSTKVQILTPEEQHEGVMDQLVRLDAVQASSDLYKGLWVVALQLQVLLSLLALLVQKYKY